MHNSALDATKTVTCPILELPVTPLPEPKLHIKMQVLSTVSFFFVNFELTFASIFVYV